MTPTPAPIPTPLDVFVHTGPAAAWQLASAWTPLFVLLAALLAFFIGWKTLKQRTKADALALEQKRIADGRSEWWRRTQWALDRALDRDPSTSALGLVTLENLAASELAPLEELKMLDNVLKIVKMKGSQAERGQEGCLSPEKMAQLRVVENALRESGGAGSVEPSLGSATQSKDSKMDAMVDVVVGVTGEVVRWFTNRQGGRP